MRSFLTGGGLNFSGVLIIPDIRVNQTPQQSHCFYPPPPYHRGANSYQKTPQYQQVSSSVWSPYFYNQVESGHNQQQTHQNTLTFKNRLYRKSIAQETLERRDSIAPQGYLRQRIQEENKNLFIEISESIEFLDSAGYADQIRNNRQYGSLINTLKQFNEQTLKDDKLTESIIIQLDREEHSNLQALIDNNGKSRRQTDLNSIKTILGELKEQEKERQEMIEYITDIPIQSDKATRQETPKSITAINSKITYDEVPPEPDDWWEIAEDTTVLDDRKIIRDKVRFYKATLGEYRYDANDDPSLTGQSYLSQASTASQSSRRSSHDKSSNSRKPSSSPSTLTAQKVEKENRRGQSFL